LICLLIYLSRHFSGRLADVPHPDLNYEEFANVIAVANEREELVFDVTKQKHVRWLKEDRLKSLYNRKGGCNCM
jgi:hypothetical protein